MKPAPILHDFSVYQDSNNLAYTENYTIPKKLPSNNPAIWQGIAEMLHYILPELASMEENLDIFKEIFIQHIRAIMRALRIHDDTRVVIGLDEDGILRIIHMQHEKAADLEAILSTDDEARQLLAAIALRTKMLTQLECLDETLNAIMQTPLEAKSYHVCLKGDLSHFYSSN